MKEHGQQNAKIGSRKPNFRNQNTFEKVGGEKRGREKEI
jgi:hypothetical protein